MNISRRKTLGLIGGGFIAAVGIGTTAFVTTRRPHAVLAPWQNAGSYADPRKNALSYAILAPNPHNLQHRMVDLTGTDTVVLYRDPERNLPHTDPFSRQITIGLGCFLEQMKIAATQTGHDVGLEAFQIEMAKLYDRSHELLAKDGETVQMLGRLGYGPLTKPAPRWPLEAKLLNG